MVKVFHYESNNTETAIGYYVAMPSTGKVICNWISNPIEHKVRTYFFKDILSLLLDSLEFICTKIKIQSKDINVFQSLDVCKRALEWMCQNRKDYSEVIKYLIKINRYIKDVCSFAPEEEFPVFMSTSHMIYETATRIKQVIREGIPLQQVFY